MKKALRYTAVILIVLLVAQVVLAAGLGSRTLKKGMRGEDVRELQRLLGFSQSQSDGIFGPGTEAAVKNFQRSKGLAADGIVGKATVAALRGSGGAAKPGPGPETPLTGRVHTVVKGDTLSKIAAKYESTVSEIKKANNLSSDVIRIGQKLHIPAREKAVWAYLQIPSSTDTRPWDSLAKFGEHLDRVLVPLAPMQADGSLVPKQLPDQIRSLHTPWDLVVTNFSGSSHAATANSVFVSPARTERAIREIVNLARETGASGVQLDFESLNSSDRARYVAFATAVGKAVKAQGLLFTIAVPARTREQAQKSWAQAYDYAGLAAASDGLVIMSYDQHWSGGAAGPIAGVAWVREVVSYALEFVPKSKLVMGMPSYGRDWPEGGTATSVSHADATANAAAYGVQVTMSEPDKVPMYQYTDASGVLHRVYFEDARSWGSKVELADELGVSAVAFWKLGWEDPASWERLAAWKKGQ